MLAVGSVSGLAVGIGAQSLISSVLSGVNLFLTVPFLVGDRVELRDASGTPLASWRGSSSAPLCFRLDSGLPVEVPNSSLTTLMICNQSRTKEADEVEKQSFQSDPRALNMSISVELAADKGVARADPQSCVHHRAVSWSEARMSTPTCPSVARWRSSPGPRPQTSTSWCIPTARPTTTPS
eukprot:jgi/Tetstr1/441981/TSEL_030186.t1